MQTNVKSSVKISPKSVVKFCKVFLKSYFLWKRFRRSPPCLAVARQGGGGEGASRFQRKELGASFLCYKMLIRQKSPIFALEGSRARVKNRWFHRDFWQISSGFFDKSHRDFWPL